MKFLIFFLIIPSFTLGALSPAQTARTKSLGGAGVASILINEAPLLNPASIVFFTKSTALYNRSTLKIDKEAAKRNESFNDQTSELAVITDTSSGMRGGFSYFYQREGIGKRKQFSLSVANNLGKSTGMGFILRVNDEESLITNKKYEQLTFGLTHIINNDLSIGFKVEDLTQRVSEYFSFTGGFQYTFKDIIILVADIGSGDVKNYKDEIFHSVGLQLETFNSLFLRAGQFHNKNRNEKGSSFGFAWSGPKLTLEYAVKKVSIISQKSDIVFKDDEFLENTIELTMLF